MAPPSVRRWQIVAALFVVTYCISTPLAAYGVFLPVLAEQFGWSRGAISAALSVNLLVGGVAGFAVGTLADRRGPRLLLVVTVTLSGAAFALVSIVGALWQLYLLVGLLGGIGMSSFYLLSTATVTHWFDERRGLALALVLVGFNLGYITGGPLAAWLIIKMGWRAAYWLLGGGCGLLSFCAAITVRLPRPAEQRDLLRSPPGPAGGGPVGGMTLRQSLSDPRQWGLNLSWLLLGGLAIMISVHAVPFARDRGVSLADASFALTAYGIGSAAGRLISGFVSDRVGTRSDHRGGVRARDGRAGDAPVVPVARGAARLAGGLRRGLRRLRHDGREGDPGSVRAPGHRGHHGGAGPRLAPGRRDRTGRGGLSLRPDRLLLRTLRRRPRGGRPQLDPLHPEHLTRR